MNDDPTGLRALLLDSVPLAFGGGYEAFLMRMASVLVDAGALPTIATPRRFALTRSRKGRIEGGPVHEIPTVHDLSGLRKAIRDSDVIYVRNEPHELLGALCVSAGRPLVVGLHSSTGKGPGRQDVGTRLYQSTRYGSLLRKANRIHALQESQAAWCVRRHRVEASRISVIPNGVDLERFRPGRVDCGPLRVLFAGRLDGQKGVDTLLTAVKAIQGAEGPNRLNITVAGDGPLRSDLDAVARDAPWLSVMGHVDDIPALMANSDLLIVPSRWEAMALVPLEGLASGLPVVLSTIPEFDLLQGKAVVRVPTEDGAGLARELMALSVEKCENPHVWASRVAAARQMAEERFDQRSSSRRFVEMLQLTAADRP